MVIFYKFLQIKIYLIFTRVLQHVYIAIEHLDSTWDFIKIL